MNTLEIAITLKLNDVKPYDKSMDCDIYKTCKECPICEFQFTATAHYVSCVTAYQLISNKHPDINKLSKYGLLLLYPEYGI